MRATWTGYVLLFLTAEKIVQHTFVTLAFYFDWGNIRSTVAVNPDVLMVLGASVAVLFGVSLWGLGNQRNWAISLVIFLAVFDLVGEMAAQGRVVVALNVSFLVAIVLLVLALMYQRQEKTRTTGR